MMKLSKKQLTILIGFILLLGVGNVALAILYMSRDLEITGGIDAVGQIEIYDSDAETVLTNVDFPNFTGSIGDTHLQLFYINNTGNQPLNVTWEISASSFTWLPISVGYDYWESGAQKYILQIETNIAASWVPLAPLDYATPGILQLAVGESAWMRMSLQYGGYPNLAETFSFTITFYAEDQ